MTFERYPDYVNELIEIDYCGSNELFKIRTGIRKFSEENHRYYDYDVDEAKREVLITVDDYNDYKRLKYLILTAKTSR